MDKIAIAQRIECKAGLIWIPPTGKPYWIEQPNAGRKLTDDEIKKYINGDINGRPN